MAKDTSDTLISMKTSEKTLRAIRNNLPIELEPNALPRDISIERIEQLRVQYQAKLRVMNESKLVPRNKIFYELIKERHPTFSWEIVNHRGNFMIVQVDRFYVNNCHPTLLSLLIQDLSISQKHKLRYRYVCIKDLTTDFSEDLSQVMRILSVVYPNQTTMKNIVLWLQQGLAGKKLVMISPVCPDYSFEETGNLKRPFRYTFNKLGSGIGLVAKRAVDAIPILDNFFKKYNIFIEYVIAMGDFEAHTQSNLNRLNLTEDTFLSKLKGSRSAIQQACPIVNNVSMVTELCGGKENWLNLLQLYRNRLEKHDFGQSSITKKTMMGIIKARKKLYDQWYGERSSLEEYITLLINQGAEYAAMGDIFSKNFSNALILGCDHCAMEPFYTIASFIPTLYLQPAY